MGSFQVKGGQECARIEARVIFRVESEVLSVVFIFQNDGFLCIL